MERNIININYSGRILALINTKSYIHLQLFHLLFNAIFIYQFGKIIEHHFGWWRLTIIIIGSAF
ncbi:MAG: rhomboid family intramembrane serine protease [Turicibacter sanguinis]